MADEEITIYINRSYVYQNSVHVKLLNCHSLKEIKSSHSGLFCELKQKINKLNAYSKVY